MCGFCGFTGTTADDQAVIQSMITRISHRGPDSTGMHIDHNIALGFCRLSFLDLEAGTQPMYNEDKTLVIVFNGEIYNFQPLREELQRKGHIFANQSDTEVLLHLYEEEGPDMLTRLRGMFAFVIYDVRNNKIFGARDYFGIKPFYYTMLHGGLMFGSEIKCFLEHPLFEKRVNKLALENYLTFQYSVLEETFFEGVHKLPPAHYFVFNPCEGDKLHIKRYWQADFDPEEGQSLEATIETIDACVQDSIEKHKISDVEVGAFLSSGVDSSYVAASFKGAKTFTVGFAEDDYSEIDYADLLSQSIGALNYSKTITTEEYWDALNTVQYHMDEPLADPSAVALYFVSQVARKYVKAAMSGEGADEFFGGYNIYKEPLDLLIMNIFPAWFRKLLGKLAAKIPFAIKGRNFFIRAGQSVEERFIGNAKVFSKAERERLLKSPHGQYAPEELTRPIYERCKNADDVTKMQMVDIHLWLVGDILLKADKMSMANSLEVRVPFLDKEVFEVARRTSTPFRVNRTATKYAFRMAALKHLPEEVARKKKLGFPVPIKIWLRDAKYYNRVKEAFCSNIAEHYFHTNELVTLLDKHFAGSVDNSRKIWTVYMFLLWHDQFFTEGDLA